MAKQNPTGAKKKRPQALKRDLQNEKKRLINKNFKSKVRTSVRHFEEALAKAEASNTQEALNLVYSLMDKAVKRGIINRNKASRTKARLTARAMALA